jgi:hypothetical protein
MASLIEGYNYDIFISYRQKDNKYDGWVTEFVDNLKKELDATFKEDISVFFDINPHDGLLESHEVEDSLKEKLKCLIFIPIISQTYCDPKSFAWEHEFKSFVDFASKDKIGLKVKLPGGNIASRVLPVKIYDLNKEDINLFELVLDGALRGIEFIYKSSGVNRPLRANEDHAQNNLNKTYYRDQINKMSHSILDLIQGLRGEISSIDKQPYKKQDEIVDKTVILNRNKRVRKYKGFPLKILLIITGLTLIIFVFLKFSGSLFKEKQSNLISKEILNKAITVSDVRSSWEGFSGAMRIIHSRADGKLYSDQIIEINKKKNYYKCSSLFYDNSRTTTGIENGKCFREFAVNKGFDKNLIENLSSDGNIFWLREHHYCLFGLLMELKSSGLKLSDKVELVKFNGTDCYALSFKSDTTKIENMYFNNSGWTVYIDQNDFTEKGYLNGNFRIEFVGGYILIGGIKIPRCRIYSNSIDNSFAAADLLMISD